MKASNLQNKLRNIYKLHKNVPKIIDDASVPTKTFEDSYVIQDVFYIHRDTGEKERTKFNAIFAPMEDHPYAEKILLEGEAGAGKTTMIYSPTLWERNYNYIFKLKLKLLINTNWEAAYGADIRKDPLTCFIDYALQQSVNKNLISAEDQVSKEEISEVLRNTDRDKILLLLDGYDEIAPLLGTHPLAQTIIEESLKFPNIMTSRPHSLPTIMENEFDRKFEAAGFDEEGIELYTKQYFTKQHETLNKAVNKFFETCVDDANIEKNLLNYFKFSTKPLEHEIFIQLKRISGSTKTLGSTKADIIKKINEYYQDTVKALTTLLSNPAVRDLASSPMNAEILCLVFSDPEVRTKFAYEATIDELYKEVMVLMGKRFITKTSENSPSGKTRFVDITKDKVLGSNEFKTLKEVAYQAFKNDNYMEGMVIEKIANKNNIDIRKLYDFGLLRVSNSAQYDEATDLIAQNHVFNHLSFQEYLAACSLVEKLTSAEEDIYREAAQFIADHRNEPKYLVLLKFVAGMLSKESNDNKEAITRFWEAVTCNIDGVLEFGIDLKVILIMHLLPQATKNGKIDSRILSAKKMVEFIDQIVLQDFGQWKTVIKESGYLSPNMEKLVWKILERTSNAGNAGNSDVTSSLPSPRLSSPRTSSDTIVELNSIIEIAGSFLNQLDNEKLFKTINNYLNKDSNWQVIKSSINILEKIIKTKKITLNAVEIASLFIKIANFIDNNNLKESVSKTLATLIDINKDNSEALVEITHGLTSLLEKKINNINLFKLINKLVSMEDKIILDIVMDDIINIIKRINPSAASLQNSYEYDVLNNVAQLIETLIHNGEESIANKITEKLIAIDRGRINEESYLVNFKNNAAFIIARILLVSKIEIQNKIMKFVMAHLSDDTLNSNIITAINSVLKTKTQMHHQFSNLILAKLTTLLGESNSLNKGAIIEAIGKIITVATEVTTIDITVRKMALTKLSEIAGSYPQSYSVIGDLALSGEKEMLEEAFWALLPFFELSNTQKIEYIEHAMERLTSGNIPKDTANMFLEKLLPLLAKGDYRTAKSIANIVIKEDILPETLILIANGLINLLKDNQDDTINTKIADAIESVSKANATIKDLLLTKLVEILESTTNKENSIIVKLIGEMDDVISSDNYNKILDLLVTILIKGECDQNILVNAISNIAKFDPSFTINLLSRENTILAPTAIYAIAEIIAQQAVDPSIIRHVFRQMIPLLSNARTSEGAVYAISTILKAGIDIQDEPVNTQPSSVKVNTAQGNENTQQPEPIFDLLGWLINLLDNDSKETVDYAISAINYLLDKNILDSNILNVIFQKLQTHLITEDSSEILHTCLSKIISLLPLEKIISLLRDSSPEIRQIATKLLTKTLVIENQPWEEKEKHQNEPSVRQWHVQWTNKVTNMLSILSISSEDIDKTTRQLHDTARKILQNHVKSMDSIKIMYEDNLKWINDNFDYLFNLSKNEFKIFIRAVFHKTLSDYAITDIESKFIALCITKLKFTVTITLPKMTENEIVEFTIQFYGQTYRLTGEENRKYIENIANAALVDEDGLLAKQYVQYEPLFTNTGSGILIAANDIKRCTGLLDTENDLVANKWKVSFLYLSDHLKSSPKNAFILLQKRIFGQYLVYKIFIDDNGEIDASSHMHHPRDLQESGPNSLREEIFSSMSYDKTKTRYFAKTLELSSSEVVDFIDASMEEVNDKRSVYSPNRPASLQLFSEMLSFRNIPRVIRRTAQTLASVETLIEKLYHFANKHLNLLNKGIKGNWQEDQQTFTEYNKAQLILSRDRTDSLEIEVNSFNEFKNKIDLEALEKIMTMQELKDNAKAELALIIQDPFKNALYTAIIRIMNSVYIAASAIDSKMVENHGHGAIGIIGTLLVDLSSHVPLVGVGIHLIGDIFNAIDDNEQAKGISNYVHFALHGVAMSKISEKIARKIALANLEPKESTKLLDVIDTASTIAKRGIAGNIADVLEEVQKRVKNAQTQGKNKETQNFAVRFMQGTNEEDTPESKGEKAASIIAKSIIKYIFAGKYKKHMVQDYHSQQKADEVSAFIIKEYTIPAVDNQMVNLNQVQLTTPSHATVITHANQARCVPPTFCTIMSIFINNDITDDPEFQRRLKISDKEKRKEAIKEFMNAKPSLTETNYFLKDEEGKSFLNKVEALHGREALEQMMELGKDQEFVEQILIEARIDGIEKILDIFFGIDITKAVANFERIIDTGNDSYNNEGFYLYIYQALGNNRLSKYAQKTLGTISNLAEKLEKWLDTGESGNKITIAMVMLEDLLKVVASGPQHIPVFRPAFPNPSDDDDSSGYGGSGKNPEDAINEKDMNYNLGLLQNMTLYNETLIGIGNNNIMQDI